MDALSLGVYDLAVLDIGLPGISGLEVLRRLRARRSTLPVLMLTAMDALEDRVRGLDLGADDYLAKPFDLPEFEARVRALLMRSLPSLPLPLRERVGVRVNASPATFALSPTHNPHPCPLPGRERELMPNKLHQAPTPC